MNETTKSGKCAQTIKRGWTKLILIHLLYILYKFTNQKKNKKRNKEEVKKENIQQIKENNKISN